MDQQDKFSKILVILTFPFRDKLRKHSKVNYIFTYRKNYQIQGKRSYVLVKSTIYFMLRQKKRQRHT